MLITKQPHDPQPSTDSEKLFASYLDAHGYSGRLFEPQIDERSKHPDFLVAIADRHFVFEVKQRVPNAVEPSPAWINPYKGVRKHIEKARTKFEAFDDLPCSLVIYNAGDIDTRMEPEYVFGAMLGDLGIGVTLGEKREAIRGSVRNLFLPKNGKMVASYTTGTPHGSTNTINAVIILERCRLRNRVFEKEVASAIARQENTSETPLNEHDRALTAITIFQALKTEWKTVVRMRVCENPWARFPLPDTMFTGQYDERWKIVNGTLERVWNGDGVDELES